MIGKAIYSILSSSSALAALVDSKFYPVVMPENTLMPCVVWRTTGSPEYSKSSAAAETSSVTFSIFSEDYDETIEIFEVLRTDLENVRGIYNGVTVGGARITNYLDDYDREAAAFLLQVSFNFRHS